MTSVAELREWLADKPGDAQVFAYEGELAGLVVVRPVAYNGEGRDFLVTGSEFDAYPDSGPESDPPGAQQPPGPSRGV